jgi:hypothetical protein
VGSQGNGDGFIAVAVPEGQHVYYLMPKGIDLMRLEKEFSVKGGKKYSLKFYYTQGDTSKAKLSPFKRSDITGRKLASFVDLNQVSEPKRLADSQEKGTREVGAAKQEDVDKLAAKVNRLVDNEEKDKLRKFLDEHPQMVGYIKDPAYRLLLSGPPELRVGKIVKMLEKGFAKEIVVAKIQGVETPYKDFSMQELELLKELGLDSRVIAAMMEVSTQLKKDEKRRERQEAYLAEQRRLMRESQAAPSGGQGKGAGGAAGGVGDEVGRQVGKEVGKQVVDFFF